MRTFLGKSDFYWPLMVLAEQWQCSLYVNVLSVQSSVPSMFLHFLNGRVTNQRVPPFPITIKETLDPRSGGLPFLFLRKYRAVKNF